MTTCLAIEASTEVLSLATCAGARGAVRELAPARRESARLYLHVAELLAEVGVAMADLRCVAFGAGPGSFTGVRLAAAAAQSLAWPLGAAVVRRSSLAVMAAGVLRRHDVPRVAVCVDARMGRVYFARYARAPGGDVVAEVADCLIGPAELAAEAVAHGTYAAAGNGWTVHAALAAAPAFSLLPGEGSALPAAADLLSMARNDLGSGHVLPPGLALPEYLAHGPVVAPAGAADRAGQDEDRGTRTR